MQPTFGGIVKTPPSKNQPFALLQLSRQSSTSDANSDTLVVDVSAPAGDTSRTFGETTTLFLHNAKCEIEHYMHCFNANFVTLLCHFYVSIIIGS